MGAKAPREYQVNFTAQQAFQLFRECQIVAEATIIGEVHQQIDVTVGTLFAASDGSEHAQIGCSVFRG